MVSLESLSKVSYSHSIVTIAVSRTVSKIQRDVGLKSRLFHTPLHSAPQLGGGGSPSEHCRTVGRGKTPELWGYPKVKKV